MRSREEFRTATTIARKAAKPAKKTPEFFFAGLAALRDKELISQLPSERFLNGTGTRGHGTRAGPHRYPHTLPATRPRSVTSKRTQAIPNHRVAPEGRAFDFAKRS